MPGRPEGTIRIEDQHPRLTLQRRPLRTLVTSVAREEAQGIAELNIVLTDHSTLLEMNRRYLEHDFHTDVLAFDLREPDGPPGIVGEVYVDLDTAAERCSEFGASFEDEAARYVVHGLLHLCGYSDKSEQDASLMRVREDDYLRRFWARV